MTQLLLFDSPTSLETSQTIATKVVSPTPPTVDHALQTIGKRQSRGPIDDHQPGMHRMGDLARLVLMRHDMVAQRRAELAAKRGAELAEKRAVAR